MTMDEQWWQAFFDHADALVLSRFPSAADTKEEVFALQQLVPLRPEDLIADVCCGMGRHLLPLMALGHRMIGLDFSPMMLRMAREMGQRAGLQPALVQGAAQALPFPDQCFEAMLNLFNSFGYLPTDEENLQVLREAARCLKPGGRFFLDTRNNTHQILYAPYHEVMKVGKHRQFVMRCTYRAESHRLESRWTDAADPSRLVHTASIRLYSPDELAAMLAEAGFELVARYGGYDGHEFEGWERELLLLCHRR